MPVLRTERLQIVPFTPRLIELAIAADEASVTPQAGRRTALEAELGAQVPAEWPGPDFAEALPFFLSLQQADPGLADWMALILHEGHLIGDIGFKGRPDERGMVEIGYSLVPGARGQGFATEAVRALVAWALQQMGVQRVTAQTLPTNQPSMRVLERVGFQQVGEQDGHVQWTYRA